MNSLKSIRPFLFLFLLMLTFSLSSCSVVGDIFKAGAWTGIILAVLVILLVFWVINRVRR